MVALGPLRGHADDPPNPPRRSVNDPVIHVLVGLSLVTVLSWLNPDYDTKIPLAKGLWWLGRTTRSHRKGYERHSRRPRRDGTFLARGVEGAASLAAQITATLA
jgi:hypothetical protein